MTRDEVRAEHLRAMARLDPEQVEALKRINCAFRNSRFTNQSVKEAMETIFEEEARHRSGDGPRPAHLDTDHTAHDAA
jgi:hypothetical protein